MSIARVFQNNFSSIFNSCLENCYSSTRNILNDSSNSISSSSKSLNIKKNKKKTSKFETNVDELTKLMEFRGLEAIDRFEQFGSIQGLCQKLKVSINEGLNSQDDDGVNDIKLRKEVFGKNKFQANTSKSFLSLVLEALQERTLIMLELCALVSLVLSFYNPSPQTDKELDHNPYIEQENRYGFIESVAIMISIIITVLVMAFSEYSKEAKFRALQNRLEMEHKINVLRNGAIHEISTSDLVVGDICIIKYGDVIPADGILFECNELRIDESSMTGESDLVSKELNKDIILFAGSHVMEGSGRMIIIAVGSHSQTGIIYALMKQNKKQKSILQNKLADLAVNIGYFGISVAIITIMMLIIRSCLVEFAIKQEKFKYKHVKEFFDHFITGITILVVAVPEGLPLAVTLSLAYSCKQMMKDNNLVRHIDACETMGNATTICSDKTGTLTANKMTAVQCYTCGIYYRSLSKRTLHLPKHVADIIAENIALNSANTSRVRKEENNIIKQYGNKTECALLALLYKLQYDYVKIRNEFSEKNFHRIFAFNSTRKLMRTIIKLPKRKGFRLLAKGASEIILQKCSFIFGANGELLKLTLEERNKFIKNVVKVMALNGLRTICLAYLDYVYDDDVDVISHQNRINNFKLIKPNSEVDWHDELSYCNMTCLAIVAIEDPIRKDVPMAIKKCQKSGITVRMVTGDNIDTARSIAIKCGIIDPTMNDDRVVLDSKQFNMVIRNQNGDIDQDLFDNVWPRLRVLARSTPLDKYILVKHIIESNLTPSGEVVAVTGDGTNDAPALKMAHVGFAMGISGTEVAKEASDIILTDDNFSSIIKSVIWGRNVYDSITKFIQFQLTVNIVAVLICFISSCTIQESPLRPVQMLWVNLIMDTLGSVSLSTEKPSKSLLLRKPFGRNTSVISLNMLKIIIANVFYQLAILVIILFYGPKLFDFDSGFEMTKGSPTIHFTMLFNIFVMMTLFNEINSRKINGERNILNGITTNWVFCAIFLTTFILQVCVPNMMAVVGPDSLSIDNSIWKHLVSNMSIGLESMDVVFGYRVQYAHLGTNHNNIPI